ncbi:MAG: NAD-dependent epimerase/dehydratase family protein [Phycisphaeraceae bacterium]
MSDSSPSNPSQRVCLIVGCGYLGIRLAKTLIAQGQIVYGTTRTPAKAAQLSRYGIRPLILQVTQPVTYAALTPVLTANKPDVYYLVPPGRANDAFSPRQVILGGIAHMVKALRQADVRRAILTSSSAVYGQTGGKRVDADTPPCPNSERAKLLLQGEQLWLDAGPNYHVLRLAGMYGPGRIIGARAVREGAPLVGEPNARLNLIHVDDAVDLLLALARSDTLARVELGCDGNPPTRLEYYRELAVRLGVPPPKTLDHETAGRMFGLNAERLARSSNKFLDNTATCNRTGWTPHYPDFRAGFDAIFRQSAHPSPHPTG